MSDILIGYDLRERPGSIEVTVDGRTRSLSVDQVKSLVEKLTYAARRVQEHNHPPRQF